MKSMTGMGRTQGKALDSQFRIEIKSINHRFCEVNVRLPGRLSALDIPIQNLIKSKLGRGKIDLYLLEEKQPESTNTEKQAYKNYYDYLKSIQNELQIPGPIEMKDLLPNVNSWMQKDVNTDAIWVELKPLIEKALEDLLQMRQKEGGHLKEKMVAHFNNIETIAHKIRNTKTEIEKSLQTKIQERIQTKLEEHDSLDPQRLHTEVIFYLDRIDITEELQRIESHLKQAHNFLNKEEPIGRKLDFLIQEFNREFNTIASKCQNSEMSHDVVEAKSQIEKIREQIQNVE